MDLSEDREDRQVSVAGFTPVTSEGRRRTADRISLVTLLQVGCLTDVLRRGLGPPTSC